MISYKSLLRLFGIVYKHNLVPQEKLMLYRKLSKNYRNAINNNFSAFRIMHQTYNFVKETLWYDPTEYDSQVYKRRLLKKSLVDNKTRYTGLKIPWINVIPMPDIDLDDQYVVEWRKLPSDYYTFLELYEKYPSTRVRLYPMDIVEEVVDWQYYYLENSIFDMESSIELCNIITFIPICYVKHFKQNPEDTQFVMFICYVNVVDTRLDSEFPFPHERFFTIELELDDLESNERHFQLMRFHLNDLTQRILHGEETMLLPKNIATQLGTFEFMFSSMLSHQEFNI